MTVTTWTRLRNLRESVHFTLLRAHEALLDREDERSFELPRPGRRFALVVGVVVVAASVMMLEPARAWVMGSTAIREGDGAANLMHGGGANERMFGLGGDDVIMGNAGDDVLHGGGGADHLDGGDGNDALHAGAGPHRDVLVGGAGDDRLYATANDAVRDYLLCGPGNDVAHVVSVNGKVIDRTVGCERIVVTDIRTMRGRSGKAAGKAADKAAGKAASRSSRSAG